MIVLQTEFRKFRRIPGQIGRDARTRLACNVVGEERIFHIEIIAADADDPAFLEPPEHLRINPPVAEGLTDGERIIKSASGFSMGFSNTFAWPDVGGKCGRNPAMIRSTVDLPQPDGPTIATNSPAFGKS